jgi:thiamine biosynthesis lipoprotein
MIRHQQSKEALGSKAIITIVSNKHNTVDVFMDLWLVIELFEDRFSRFKTSSELTNFNKLAGTKVKVSVEFIDLLKAAKEWGKRTDGLYNPFILPSLQKAGYKGSWPKPQDYNIALDYELRNIHKVDQIEIGKDWAQIPNDSALDFGGCGKGYLLDYLAAKLDKQNINNYWLSLGGDIICSGKDAGGDSWSVGIQDAINEDNVVDSLTNTEGAKIAIATSGVTKRKGQNGLTKWHHLIDPKTAKPAKTDILTATVQSLSAIEADVLAKCLVIIGSGKIDTFASRMRLSKAIIQIGSEPNEAKIVKIGF